MTAESILEFSRTIEGQGVEDHQNCTYTSAELSVLIDRTLALPYGATVVEVGVYGGRSASVYFQLQKELNLNIHLVDNWSWDAHRAMRTFSAMVIDHFSEVPFTLHKMLSGRLASTWTYPVDLLHIDGWHDMPGIQTDCECWLPLVDRGGVAVFHDSYDPAVRVCLDKYVRPSWDLIGHAERTTAWRKP